MNEQEKMSDKKTVFKITLIERFLVHVTDFGRVSPAIVIFSRAQTLIRWKKFRIVSTYIIRLIYFHLVQAWD